MNPETHTSHFFSMTRCHVDDVLAGQHAELIPALRQGEIQAIQIDGVYARDYLGGLVGRLQAARAEIVESDFPAPFRSGFYGINLNLCPPDLDEYFSLSQSFNTQMENLFGKTQAPQHYLAKIFSHLDQQRPYIAPAKNQTDYMFATLRWHDEQGYIPAHCDNEFMLRPGYVQLATECDPHIISYVAMLQAAESGGETEIFNYVQQPVSHTLMSDDQNKDKPDINLLESVKLAIPAGSVLLFDSGRYLHRVTLVQGKTMRWTACSFMARTHSGNETCCWG